MPTVDCSGLGQCNGTWYTCPSGSVVACDSLTCVTPPTVDIKANSSNGPITLDHNSSATLSWTTTGILNGCTASGAWSGTKSVSGGTQSTGILTGPQIYTYTLTCNYAGGVQSINDNVTVNVTAPPPPPRCPPPGRPDQTKYCASQDLCTLPTNDCSSAALCSGQWQFCPSSFVVNCGPPVTCDTVYCGSGLTRATGLVSTPSFSSGSNFATTGACIVDPKAAFAPFRIPTFDDLKSLYFDQSKSSKDTLSGDQTGNIDLTGPNDKIYHITGNLTLDNPSDITGNQTGVIFIDGNLTIGPMPGNKLQSGTANSGLVFVIKGDVNIDPSVTRIDAVIISEGTICTAFDGTSCPSSNVSASQLTINGSLISLNPGKPIKFRRTLSNNSQPAEKINHQVKYLVILRNLISDTLQKWSEIP